MKSKIRGCAFLFILLCACRVTALGQHPDAPDFQRIFIPGTNVALDLDLRAFGAPIEREAEFIPANDGRVREMWLLSKPVKGRYTGFSFLKIRVEPERAAGGAAALREAALAERLKLKGADRKDFKPADYKQTPLLRYKLDGPSRTGGGGGFLTYSGLSPFPVPYSTGPFPAKGFSSRVLEAYMAQGGAWVTLSHVGQKLEPEGEQTLYAVLDSAKFADAASPSSSYDYYTLGGELYRLKRPAEAVAALEKSLALEQERRALTQPQWRQLVMTLANALGAADDPERAREVLEYGVAGEPTYPYFHHGLSRLHSHFGDLDRALASLEKAYEHAPDGKSFQSLLGAIPDPLLDPAFRRYKDDPRFRDAVKALKKKYKP